MLLKQRIIIIIIIINDYCTVNDPDVVLHTQLAL